MTTAAPTATPRAEVAAKLRALAEQTDKIPSERAPLVGMWIDVAAEGLDMHATLCRHLDVAKLRELRIGAEHEPPLVAILDEALALLRGLR